MKLTKAQREFLSWIASANGVTDINDRAWVDRLAARGFVRHNQGDDSWFITDAGRAALSGAEEWQRNG